MAVNIVRKSKNEEEEEKRKQLLAQMQENSQARKNAEIQAVKSSKVHWVDPTATGVKGVANRIGWIARNAKASADKSFLDTTSAFGQSTIVGLQRGANQSAQEQTTWDKIKNYGKNVLKSYAYTSPDMVSKLLYMSTIGRQDAINENNQVANQIAQNYSQAQTGFGKFGAIAGGVTSKVFQDNNSLVQGIYAGGQQLGQALGEDKAKQTIENITKTDTKLHEKNDKKLEELRREGTLYDGVTRKLGETGQTVGYMTPSIAIGLVTGGAGEAVGLAQMGLAAKGSTTREAIQQGADLETAERKGVASGTAEALSEKMFGGLKAFKPFKESGVEDVAKKYIAETIEKRISSQLGQTVAKTAGNWLVDVTGETIEELTTDIYDTWLDQATTDPNAEYTLDDAINTAVGTALSTTVLNVGYTGLNKGIQKVYDRNQARANNQESIPEAEKIESNGYKENLQEMINNLDVPDEVRAQIEPMINSDASINAEEYKEITDSIKTFVKANTQQQIDSLSNDLNNQYIDINNRLSELDNIKAENFKDPESRRFYAQQINKEFGDTTLDSILAGYPENRNGNRTVKQYKEIAKEYGKQMAENGLTFDEVRANTVGAWQYYEPNKNITRYDNKEHKNASFDRLNSQVWSEEVYNSYKDTMRTQLQQQQEALSTQMNDELTRLQDEENILIDTIDNLKPKASPEQVARTKKLIEDFAKARGVNLEYNAEVFKNNNEEGFIKDKGNGERTIYINPNADTDTILVKLATHEMFHDTIRTQPHDKLTQLVMDKLKADENYDMYRQSVVDAYLDELNKLENTNKEALTIDELTDKQNALIDEEMTAKYLGEYLGDEQFVQQLVNSTNRSTIQKIMDWIDNRLQQIKNVVTGNKEAEYWRKVRENFEKAYNSKYQGQEGTQYSIQTDNKGRTLTSEQEDYFKDSKVRDRDGNLITLYHGTDNEVTTFDTNKPTYARYGSGAYLTDGIGIASEFADIRAESNNGKARIIEGYANIDKMFDNTTGLRENTPERQKLFELLKERGLSDRQLSNIESAEIDYPFQLMERYLVKDEVTNDPWIKANTVNELLREAGYNGIKGYYGDGSYEYVTFNSNQIKDIENKKPTTNDDIRYSKKTKFDEALKQDNQGRTLTKEQQEYFKDSKVRDSEGRLLEVYHGSKKGGFTVFDKNKIKTGATLSSNMGDGFYFTDNQRDALEYSKQNENEYGQLFATYLNIENPFIATENNMSKESRDILSEFSKKIAKEHPELLNKRFMPYEVYDGHELTGRAENGMTLYSQIIDEYGTEWTNFLKEKGYDGIIYDSYSYKTKTNGKNYIAFESNQIKNADNTKPTSNSDIRYNIKSTEYDDYLKANNPNRSGVTIGDLQQKLPTKTKVSLPTQENTTNNKVSLEDYLTHDPNYYDGEQFDFNAHRTEIINKANQDIIDILKNSKNLREDLRKAYDLNEQSEGANNTLNTGLDEDNRLTYQHKESILSNLLHSNNIKQSAIYKELINTQPILPTQENNIANDYIKFRELTEQVKNGDITEAEFDRLSNLDDIQQELKNLGKTDKQVQDIIFELGNLRDNQLNERDINNLINLMGLNAYDREVARNKIAKGETLLPTTNVQATTESLEIPNEQTSIPLGEQVNPSERKQRKAYKSIIESPYMSEEAKKVARKFIGQDTYTPDSNLKQLERADNIISRLGVEKALNQLESNAMEGRTIKAEDIATGDRLIQYYSLTGDSENLQRAIRATAMAGTQAGRSVQAFALLKHQTPQGMAVWIQNSVDKLNSQTKNGQFDFTTEMQEKILNSTEDNLQENVDEVMKELGQQVPQSLLGKLDTWRYFSMLANPKTHIRNIVGNFAMGLTQQVKSKVAGTIEQVTGQDRTHTSLFEKRSRANIDFAKNDLKNVSAQLGIGESKYSNPKNQIQQNQRVFKSDALEKSLGRMFKMNDKLLEAEDNFGLKNAYVRNLSDYMTANKLNPNTITNEQLQQARKVAIEEALRATFHQESSLASMLNQIEKKNLASRILMGGLVPFKKTPINVAKSGFEYSPAGLAKAIVYDSVQLRKGNINVNEYIDNISKGLTGTGIALVGYALAEAGILKAGGDDDKEDKYKQAMGEQEYSINNKPLKELLKKAGIDVPDTSYSLDWLAPTGIPLFVGAELNKLMHDKTEKDGETQNDVLKAMGRIADATTSLLNPMSEMSMISGLTSTIQSFSSDPGQALMNLVVSPVKSYVGQAVPTALGQVARTTDKYERDTSSTETGLLPKAIDQTKNQIMNKIPGLRQMLPTKKDVWGEEVETQDYFHNAVLPYTEKEIKTNAVDKELNDLFERTGESIYPNTSLSKTVTYEGSKTRLTNQDYNDFKTNYGKTSYKLLEDLTKSKEYKGMSDEQKVQAIKDVYTYANNLNKTEYAQKKGIDFKTPTDVQQVQAIQSYGGKESDYFKYKGITDGLSKDSEKLTALKDSNLSSKSKRAVYSATLGKDDTFFQSTDINVDEYLGYKTANIQGVKDSNGKTISGSKKAAQLDYINNNISGYENRLLLMGKDYKLSRSQQQDLAAYIDTLDNAEELYTMFDKNFTVKSSSSLGQYGKGNIDLYNRPIVTNSDGSISTVRSMSFEENGQEVLIPTVVNGRVVSDDEAINHYHRTGEYLGKFNSIKEADDYAEKLHEDQEKMYSSSGRTTGYTVYYK